MKSCIVHGCMPANCGCPESISQVDRYIQERTVDKVPTLLGMLPDNCEEGIEADSEGPFTWLEETVRTEMGTSTRTLSFRRKEEIHFTTCTCGCGCKKKFASVASCYCRDCGAGDCPSGDPRYL